MNRRIRSSIGRDSLLCPPLAHGSGPCIASVTSCDPQRTLSRGSLTVAHLSHSLSETTTCAVIVSGQVPDLIPSKELLEFFHNKLSRAPNGFAHVAARDDRNI